MSFLVLVLVGVALAAAVVAARREARRQLGFGDLWDAERRHRRH